MPDVRDVMARARADRHMVRGVPARYVVPTWATYYDARTIIDARSVQIGDGYGSEEGPTATVTSASLPGELSHGAYLTVLDDTGAETGERYAIEGYRLERGIYMMTLRPDTV